MSDGKSFFQQYMGGYIAGAAVLAFFTTPLLPLVDPTYLLLEAALVATGVGFAWDAPTTRRQMATAIFGVLCLCSALIFGAYLLIPAANDLKALTGRCLVYEADMIASKPRWSNSRDLFQALGCRPQSQKIAIAQGHSDHIDVQGTSVTEPIKPPAEVSKAKAAR